MEHVKRVWQQLYCYSNFLRCLACSYLPESSAQSASVSSNMSLFMEVKEIDALEYAPSLLKYTDII